MNAASLPSLTFAADPVDSFTAHVLSGDGREAARMVEQLLAASMTPENVMDQVFAPSARLLGQMWCDDERDFVEVTLGLARIQRLLRQLGERAPTPRFVRGRALLLPVPGEQHTFGLRLVEERLMMHGWKVDTELNPTENDLLRRLAADIYDFVGFSIAGERLLPVLRSAIRCVRSSSRNREAPILVGGVLFAGQARTATELDVDAIAMNAEEAVAQANRWSALAGVM